MCVCAYPFVEALTGHDSAIVLNGVVLVHASSREGGVFQGIGLAFHEFRAKRRALLVRSAPSAGDNLGAQSFGHRFAFPFGLVRAAVLDAFGGAGVVGEFAVVAAGLDILVAVHPPLFDHALSATEVSARRTLGEVARGSEAFAFVSRNARREGEGESAGQEEGLHF